LVPCATDEVSVPTGRNPLVDKGLSVGREFRHRIAQEPIGNQKTARVHGILYAPPHPGEVILTTRCRSRFERPVTRPDAADPATGGIPAWFLPRKPI